MPDNPLFQRRDSRGRLIGKRENNGRSQPDVTIDPETLQFVHVPAPPGRRKLYKIADEVLDEVRKLASSHGRGLNGEIESLLRYAIGKQIDGEQFSLSAELEISAMQLATAYKDGFLEALSKDQRLWRDRLDRRAVIEGLIRAVIENIHRTKSANTFSSIDWEKSSHESRQDS